MQSLGVFRNPVCDGTVGQGGTWGALVFGSQGVGVGVVEL